MDQHARHIFEAAKATFAPVVKGLSNLEWEQLPPKIVEYIKNHPGMTAFQLACLLVVVMPGLVATPGLLALGFSSEGPIAGFIAAAFQSMYGTPIAFRVAQSAAMGGWGASIVNAIVQGSVLVSAVIVGGIQKYWNQTAEGGGARADMT